jgi:hypothetical protein
MAEIGRKGGKAGKGTAWRREVCRHAAIVRWRAHYERERLRAERAEARAAAAAAAIAQLQQEAAPEVLVGRDEADREYELASAAPDPVPEQVSEPLSEPLPDELELARLRHLA